MDPTPGERGRQGAAAEPTTTGGVRTEHQLRLQLRAALERNTTFERALRASAAFAYGRREMADLRRLRAVLSAAGFPDPAQTQAREARSAPPSPNP